MLEEKDGEAEVLTEGELDGSVGGGMVGYTSTCRRCGKVYQYVGDRKFVTPGLCQECVVKERGNPGLYI